MSENAAAVGAEIKGPGVSVSVIVPLYNGRELIADCLGSIPANAEVIVVDDASTDGAPDLVEQQFPWVTLLRNDRNHGFAYTTNRGLEQATSPVRLLLNSDARLRPHTLDSILAAFADDPEIGIVGTRRVFPDGSHQGSAASFPTIGSIVTGSFLVNEVYRHVFPHRRFRWELGLSRRDHAQDRDVDWVVGTAIAIHERCLSELGGFDEGYRMYVEETDLCWRARQRGWRVRYLAGAVVEHIGGGSTGDPRAHARRAIPSEARFMARAYGRKILPRWRAARGSSAVVKLILLAVPGLVDRRVRDRIRWQWAALRCVVGPTWAEALDR